jgi:hypothetical protein
MSTEEVKRNMGVETVTATVGWKRNNGENVLQKTENQTKVEKQK